jgi:chromosomal replication initiator protein
MIWINSSFNRIAANTLEYYDPRHASALTLVYGPTGVGKTELLRACFTRLKKDVRVIYLDAEDFSRSYSFAAQEGFLNKFRDRLRSTPLVIFDHLEKLKGKKRSIEEFLHTYEALRERDAKLIVGFQGAVSELEFLGEKLSSRMLGGLAIPVHPPSDTDLFNYCWRSAKSRYLTIDDTVLEFVAQRVSNFREAQEFLNGFIRYANEFQEALDFEAFSQYLVYREQELRHRPTPDNIVRKVAELTELEPEQIYGNLRVTRIVEARQLAIYTIRELCRLSYPETGRLFNKAHSAIIKSCQQFQERLNRDHEWADKFKLLFEYFLFENKPK